MSRPVFILETHSGGRVHTFDSLDRAKAEARRHLQLHGTRFNIIEQRIVERIIAS